MIDTCLSITIIHNLQETLQNAAVLNFKRLMEIDLGNTPAAAGYLLERLRLRELLYTDPDNQGIATSKSSIGIAYMEMGKLDRAMEYHQRSLE